ncbi:MAG: thiamine phosphate synthase [Epulopiscium sp.]|nr:thiamine phosphate synthase [Candidatus Epulonipiscium sp.]
MTSRKKFNLMAYFIVGPENTKGRPVSSIVEDAIESGFTFIQIRSKEAPASELIRFTVEAADIIEKLGKTKEVTLVVNDRLDIVLAARKQGAKVDGIHVGQEDIPVDVCREYLGEESIIGLSARTDELFEYMKTVDVSMIDYFGVGPLRETETKPDCGLGLSGEIITRSFEDIKKLVRLSPLPIVVGGGVKVDDIEQLVKVGADGFFVVSAVSMADNPKKAALELVDAWKENE